MGHEDNRGRNLFDGGISEDRKIGLMAETSWLSATLHDCGGAVSIEVELCLSVETFNTPAQEFTQSFLRSLA